MFMAERKLLMIKSVRECPCKESINLLKMVCGADLQLLNFLHLEIGFRFFLGGWAFVPFSILHLEIRDRIYLWACLAFNFLQTLLRPYYCQIFEDIFLNVCNKALENVRKSGKLVELSTNLNE